MAKTKAACKRATKALDDPSNYVPANDTAMVNAYEKLAARSGRIHIINGRTKGKRAFIELLREQGLTVIDASLERPDGIET